MARPLENWKCFNDILGQKRVTWKWKQGRANNLMTDDFLCYCCAFLLAACLLANQAREGWQKVWSLARKEARKAIMPVTINDYWLYQLALFCHAFHLFWCCHQFSVRSQTIFFSSATTLHSGHKVDIIRVAFLTINWPFWALIGK